MGFHFAFFALVLLAQTSALVLLAIFIARVIQSKPAEHGNNVSDHPVAGVAALISASIGFTYLGHLLGAALSSGHIEGKMGTVHHAGSIHYAVSVAACVVGLVMMLILATMGAQWMGVVRKKGKP